MSKFSVYLKELLKQRGEPIARVAKNLGIERTSIHKALKDERVLPYTALKKLVQYLELSLPQARELNQYYEMLLQGEDIYRIQEAICELLSDLSQLHFSAGLPGERDTGEEGPAPGPGLVHGTPQVEAAIRSVLKRETGRPDAEIGLYLPTGCQLPNQLFWMWQEGRKFTVRQLLSFWPSRQGVENRLKNIRLIRRLLPLFLVSEGRYFARYYFDTGAEAESINPLPYFIITPRCLITMDARLSAAQFQTDPALIGLYRERFARILEECQALNSYSNDAGHILESYMRSTDREGYYTMMIQPCLGRYYTTERIRRQFREDVKDRELLIGLSDQRFGRLRELKDNYYTVFTKEGLTALAGNGIMVDLPTEFVKPFDPALRREMLSELRRDVETDVVKGCIADPEKLPVPPYLTFTCDPRHGVHIYTVQGFIGGPYACNLHIEESGIGQAFCEFIRSLPGSKFVYPKEKTLQILDDLIAGLE